MSHYFFSLCMQLMEQSCVAGKEREVEVVSLPAREERGRPPCGGSSKIAALAECKSLKK